MRRASSISLHCLAQTRMYEWLGEWLCKAKDFGCARECSGKLHGELRQKLNQRKFPRRDIMYFTALFSANAEL